MEDTNFKICLIGASGAIGREIVRYAQTQKNIKITILARRSLEEWKNISNLKIHILEDLEKMDSLEEELKDHQAFICTLGSRVKYPDFEKVDGVLPVLFGKLCKRLNIPYFSICSSTGTDKSSMFKYMRVKGQAEEDLKQLDLNNLAIFKPGFLRNRENDFRFAELFGFLMFWNNIECKDLAKAMVIHALQEVQDKQKKTSVFENSQIKSYLKDQNK